VAGVGALRRDNDAAMFNYGADRAAPLRRSCAAKNSRIISSGSFVSNADVKVSMAALASPAASTSQTRNPTGRGLANVNPIFTWVRLAQRIPVLFTSIRCPKAWSWRPT
jgi:hypothetical protein